MARTVKDVRLDSRAARERLAPRKKPYYRVIETGRHVGYYKGQRSGTWLARTIVGARYAEQKLGMADDIRDANGLDVLSFSQAQAAARDWFDRQVLDQEAKAAGPVVTVRSATEEYIAERNERESKHQGRPVNSSAAHKMKLHVLGDTKLAAVELSKLDAKALKGWREALPGTATSRQRVTNDLKAALNRAAPNASVRLIIKEGLASKRGGGNATSRSDAKAIESKILSDDETRRFLKAVRNAGNDDLYLMCLVLASTGTRFAQARLLTVGDVDLAKKRILMPASRKGRAGGDTRDAVPVPVGSDVIEALMPAIAGRQPRDLLLERWRHVQTGPMEWQRDRRSGWQSASEMSKPIRAAALAADLPAGASTYSFRHSSIVRALREGLPALLVAKLHDTSIQMIQSNYTRFIVDALDGLARKAIMPMVELDRGDNVVPIGAAERVAYGG